MYTTPQPSHGHKGGHEPSIRTDRGKKASMMVSSLAPHRPTDTAIVERSDQHEWVGMQMPGPGERGGSPLTLFRRQSVDTSRP